MPRKRKTSDFGSDLLVRRDLSRLMRARILQIEPLLDEDAMDNIGVDLRLDCFFREFVRTERPYLSPGDDSPGTVLKEIEPFRHTFFLQPGEFALAQSLEYISLPTHILGFLNGRSSLGRRGLVVHATANVVDPGWRGHLVFELANLGTMPIQLVPLMRIARLVFLRTKEVGQFVGPYIGQNRIPPPGRDELVAALLKRSENSRQIGLSAPKAQSLKL